MTADLRIKPERLLVDLADLAKIGGTTESGVSRPAFSDPDLEARDWFQARAESAGFTVKRDGIANISAIYPSSNPDAQTVLFGSHMDTVPNGGRFDGALGTLTALEALRTIKEAGLSLPVHLEAISFSDEEGTWAGLTGSRGIAGHLTESEFEHPRGDRDSYHERLKAAGVTIESAFGAKRDPATIKAWVEVHIEQGVRLTDADLHVGVVTGIVGIASYWLTFQGRAGHAGTTPMRERLDAMRGVAEFVQQSRELVMNRFRSGVVNCGDVQVSPGAFNIIPAEARMALEFRHSDPMVLEAMREALINLALHIVEVEGLGLEVEQVGIHEPGIMHRDVITALEKSCNLLGLRHQTMPAYAGHDTQVMAAITKAGMFFVPSVDGISHNPQEFTSDEDCINAGNVLLHTVLNLAQSE